jgi:hypothetical protein
MILGGDYNMANTVILDSLYPIIQTNLSKKENKDALIKLIGKYFDKYSYLLLSTNFSDRILFSEDFKEQTLSICGLTTAQVENVLKQSTLSPTWISYNPFCIVGTLILRYLELSSAKKKTDMQQHEITAMLLYISMPLFISACYGSFKYTPNKQIMDYTITNLSNNFLIRSYGTIQGMIQHTVDGSHETYYDNLMKSTDEDLNTYISALKTRLKGNMKAIATAYYDNHKSGKYLNLENDNFDEENYHEADSMSFGIDRMANKVTLSIVSHGFDAGIVQRCAKFSDVSTHKLGIIVDAILMDNRDELKPFISNILLLFVDNGKRSLTQVNSRYFIACCLEMYKTNSLKSIIVDIKNTLISWIETSTNRFGKSFVRKNTIDSYRKALFMIFMYTIFEESKK